MEKKYFTSKNKEIIEKEMAEIKKHYKDNHDKILCPISFPEQNEILVSPGRNQTYWKINLNTQNQITVKRRTTFLDWMRRVTLTIINFIIAFLVLFDRFSLSGVIFLAVFVICESMFVYYIYYLSPLKKIDRFINKYIR